MTTDPGDRVARVWFGPLVRRGVQPDTLAMLIFLSQQGQDGFTKASYLAWLGAAKESVRNPNSWVAKGARERLNSLGFRWMCDHGL